jgi:hypothetical protein
MVVIYLNRPYLVAVALAENGVWKRSQALVDVR